MNSGMLHMEDAGQQLKKQLLASSRSFSHGEETVLPVKTKGTELYFGNVIANRDRKQQKKQWNSIYSEINLFLATVLKKNATKSSLVWGQMEQRQAWCNLGF